MTRLTPKPRRRSLASATAAIGLALAAGSAQAAEETHFMIDTAADLARLCGSPAESPNYAAAIHMCQGYMIGVHHFHEALSAELETSVYCVNQAAETPSRDAFMAGYVTWIDANPDMAESEAMESLLKFAAQSFPCS